MACKMIPFNVPSVTGVEETYLRQVLRTGKLSGNNEFTRKCNRWLEVNTDRKKALLTTSCTHALEMVSLLTDIGPGDEIIMPSFTFVSTANAFVLRGAKIVFVDIRPDTMNIDDGKIEAAITEKTRAIVPVHYAGVACEMDAIMSIAQKHNLFVIEDAAQGMMSTYKGMPLGSIGHIGCFSFHETKNYNCGEGGAILLDDDDFIKRAEILWEKGTNRAAFIRGQIDKYTWVDIGSSFLPSELQAAYLYAQFENADKINQHRLNLWSRYYRNLEGFEGIELPVVPENCTHNGHMFYIKVADINQRQDLIEYLKQDGVQAVFHYIPLHSSPAGKKYGRFCGVDRCTTVESQRLLRLPMYYAMVIDNADYICKSIKAFFCSKKPAKYLSKPQLIK